MAGIRTQLLMVFVVCGGLICTVTFLVNLMVDLHDDTMDQTRLTRLNKTDGELLAKQEAITPASYSCQFAKIQGYWSHEWTWINEGCEHRLTVNESMHYLSSYMKGKMVFVGDSQMRGLRGSFFKLFKTGECTENTEKRVQRCGIVSEYFGLTKPIVWERPNHTLLVGPIGNGWLNPGCNDMRSIWGSYQCEVPATQSAVSMEFLGVEYARDVEMQNTLFDSTQESAINYLRTSTDNVSVLLVNTGVHDVFIMHRLCPDLETRKMPHGTSFQEFSRPGSTCLRTTSAGTLASCASSYRGCRSCSSPPP